MTAAERIIEAVRRVESGQSTRSEAVANVAASDLTDVLFASLEGHAVEPLTYGIAASPGAAWGKLCLSVDAVFEVVDAGEAAVMVAMETGPADEPGMRFSAAVVTAHGGLSSHAAIYSRGMGLPAVCGAVNMIVEVGGVRFGNAFVPEFAAITVDGAAGTVMAGSLEVVDTEVPAELDMLLAWADEIRLPRVGVRANADTGTEAAEARRLGAAGIGLCRTEHMFLGDRLPVVRRLLQATENNERVAALAELQVVQRSDFVDVLEAMDGLPVTVRLLDAPLHEFLEASHEQNPMLGLRGVRLALVTEGLYRTQVRALVEAVGDRQNAGGNPIVEVMVPLIALAAELAAARVWIDEEIAAASVPIAVGTMIETPRAALVAAELAAHADFFSFGTNDLTQMTLGFSRDDVETSVIAPYIEQGLLERSPFDTLDQAGVGALVALGIERARAVKPDLKVGICGEHGGDPASIAFVVGAGVDYVSCSPPRVPVARLAAAQAVLALDR